MNKLVKSLFRQPIAALGLAARIATAVYVIFLIGIFAYLIIKLVITSRGLI